MPVNTANVRVTPSVKVITTLKPKMYEAKKMPMFLDDAYDDG